MAVRCRNRYILECKVIFLLLMIYLQNRRNRYILECKADFSILSPRGGVR